MKFKPIEWEGGIAMRFDAIGLPDLYTDYIGVVKGTSKKVSATFEWSSNVDPNRYKDFEIYSRNGWKAAVNDENQWVKTKLSKPMLVHAMDIQAIGDDYDLVQ